MGHWSVPAGIAMASAPSAVTDDPGAAFTFTSGVSCSSVKAIETVTVSPATTSSGASMVGWRTTSTSAPFPEGEGAVAGGGAGEPPASPGAFSI